MADWAKAEFGNLHPHIEEAFSRVLLVGVLYGLHRGLRSPSDQFPLRGSSSHSDRPGGNAGIAQALYTKLKKNLPDCSLRSGCLVVDISQDKDAVRVCYEAPDGNLKTIQTKAVVNASANSFRKLSFRIFRMISGTRWTRSNIVLMSSLTFFSKIRSSPRAMMFTVSRASSRRTERDIAKRVWTDLTYATWAQDDQGAHAVVSLYRPYAYDKGRKELYQDGAYQLLKKDFQAAVPGLLTSMGIDPANIVEIRLSRWGTRSFGTKRPDRRRHARKSG